MGGAGGAKRGLLDNILGGGGAGGAGGAAGGAAADGEKTAKGAAEAGVSKAAGTGATSGLPTCTDNGEISVTYHQINQDGAGPLTADVDATSGGTDPAAFKKAEVTQNVPGVALGLSATTTTAFPVKVQMPQGMTCSGSVGGASNVCIARLRNNTPAGKHHFHVTTQSFIPLTPLAPRSLRWLRCFHPEPCRQEARHRVQPPQAPLRPRYHRQALNATPQV